MRFRLLDRVLSWRRNEMIIANKAVSFEEYSLRARMGHGDALPETLAIGAMLEAASFLTILSTDYEMMAWPEEIDGCEIIATPGPGESMRITAELTGRDAERLQFRITALVDERPSVSITQFVAQVRPLVEFADPADVRTLFSEIGPS